MINHYFAGKHLFASVAERNARVAELWPSELTAGEIAERCGISYSTVGTIAEALNLPRRHPIKRGKRRNETHRYITKEMMPKRSPYLGPPLARPSWFDSEDVGMMVSSGRCGGNGKVSRVES